MPCRDFNREFRRLNQRPNHNSPKERTMFSIVVVVARPPPGIPERVCEANAVDSFTWTVPVGKIEHSLLASFKHTSVNLFYI